MKDTKRALRRHHRQRMIARAMKVLAFMDLGQEERLQWALRWYNNLQKCSCHMCGHRRAHYGITVQERRQNQATLYDYDLDVAAARDH